jgi:membrane associated rhomboid family serine protease
MPNMQNEILNTFKKGSMMTKVIFINVAVYLIISIVNIFHKNSDLFLSVPGSFIELKYQPWTIITYMFSHSRFWHLLMNLLFIFWFGKMFLLYFNGKQYLAVYLLGGFAGVLFHMGVNYLINNPNTAYIIGASAAAMSIAFAIAAYKPDLVIHLLFIGPVKIKYLVLVVFVLDVLGQAGNMSNDPAASDGVAHLAHMGGSFFGIWFGYRMRHGKDITRSFNNFLNNLFSLFSSDKSKTSRQNMKVKKDKFSTPKSDWEYNQDKVGEQKEIDRILDKISKSGYGSLTKSEKEFLFKQKK